VRKLHRSRPPKRATIGNLWYFGRPPSTDMAPGFLAFVLQSGLADYSVFGGTKDTPARLRPLRPKWPSGIKTTTLLIAISVE
jgi:hypothetical protein